MSVPFLVTMRKAVPLLLVGLGLTGAALAQQPPAPLGAPPSAEAMPRVEFVFEERVTLAPAIVLGDTDLGHRQYIPITGIQLRNGWAGWRAQLVPADL